MVILFSFLVLFALSSAFFIQKNKPRSLFEPGLLFVILFALVYLGPTLLYFSDNAVGDKSINLSDIERLSLLSSIFLIVFLSFYILFSGFFEKIFLRTSFHGSVRIFESNIKFLFFIFFIIFSLSNIFLIYNFEGKIFQYGEIYSARKSNSLLSSQLLNVFGGMKLLIIGIILSTYYGSDRAKNSGRYIFYIFMLLIIEMLIFKNRLPVVQFIMMFFATQFLYGKTFGISKEILIGIFLISLFTFVTLVRNHVSYDYYTMHFLDFLVPAEFRMIFLNAIHLISILDTSDYVPPPGNSYLMSLISFIPSQINPDKFSLTNWYVYTYFPEFSESGGGLAFGVIPEAIVNWGVGSIFFQGVASSFIISLFKTLALKNKSNGVNFWSIIFVVSYPSIYQMIRNHSLILVDGFIIGYLFPFIALFATIKFLLLVKR